MMAGGEMRKKRERAARPAPESLEDRIEMTGGLTGHASAMVGRLSHRIEVQFGQISARVARLTQQLDVAYRQALQQSAGGPAAAEAGASPSIARINRDYNRLVRHTDGRVNAAVGHFRTAIQRHPQVAATARAAAPAAASQIDQLVTNMAGYLKREAQVARAATRPVVASARARIAAASNSPAQAGAAVQAAEAQLIRDRRIQVAQDRAQYQTFLDRYDAALSTVEAELAALPVASARGAARVGRGFAGAARVGRDFAGAARVGPGYAGVGRSGLLGASLSAGAGRTGAGLTSGMGVLGRTQFAFTGTSLRYGLTGLLSPNQGLAGNFGTAGLGAVPNGTFGTSAIGTLGNTSTQGFAGSFGNAGVGPVGFGSPSQGFAGNFGTAGLAPGAGMGNVGFGGASQGLAGSVGTAGMATGTGVGGNFL